MFRFILNLQKLKIKKELNEKLFYMNISGTKFSLKKTFDLKFTVNVSNYPQNFIVVKYFNRNFTANANVI